MVLKQTIHQKVNRSILKYCYLEIQLTNNLFSEKWTSLSHISNGPFKTFSKVLFSKTATITVVENKPKKSYSTLRAKQKLNKNAKNSQFCEFNISAEQCYQIGQF